MTVVLEGRLKDLISTAERQFASQSYDAAIDTYRTALGELPGDAAAEVRTEIEGRLADAERARDVSQRVSVLLRDARYHQTASRMPDAYRAVSEVLALDPGNAAATQMREQLLAAMPELATAPAVVTPPAAQPLVVVPPAEPLEVPAPPKLEMAEAPAPPPAEPAPPAPDLGPIEPPKFHMFEDDPPLLELPHREEQIDEPPLSILDPTPRPEPNDHRLAVIAVLVITFFVAIAMSAYRKNHSNRLPDRIIYSNGEVGTQPVLISKVDPEYPDEARAAGIQGTVTLSIAVETDGTVQVISVVHSVDPGLDARAQSAVHWWRFQPAMKDGHAVRSITTVAIPFEPK